MQIRYLDQEHLTIYYFLVKNKSGHEYCVRKNKDGWEYLDSGCWDNCSFTWFDKEEIENQIKQLEREKKLERIIHE